MGPWHPVTGRPMTHECNLTFQPIYTEIPTWQSIRNLAGQHGQQTVKLQEVESFSQQEAVRQAQVERDLDQLRQRQEQAARERREVQRQASIANQNVANAGQGLG